MTPHTDRLLPLRMALARITRHLGWQGWLGLALVVAALAMGGAGWRQHTSWVEAQARFQAATPVTLSPMQEAQPLLTLPQRSEVPLLLTQVQQIAVTNGLAWSAADYKWLPASDSTTAVLEVRFGVKGPYPRLRSMLAQLSREVPAAALRDVSMNRPNADAAEVEAKLAVAIFLQDAAPPSAITTNQVKP